MKGLQTLIFLIMVVAIIAATALFVGGPTINDWAQQRQYDRQNELEFIRADVIRQQQAQVEALATQQAAQDVQQYAQATQMYAQATQMASQIATQQAAQNERSRTINTAIAGGIGFVALSIAGLLTVVTIAILIAIASIQRAITKRLQIGMKVNPQFGQAKITKPDPGTAIYKPSYPLRKYEDAGIVKQAEMIDATHTYKDKPVRLIELTYLDNNKQHCTIEMTNRAGQVQRQTVLLSNLTPIVKEWPQPNEYGAYKPAGSEEIKYCSKTDDNFRVEISLLQVLDDEWVYGLSISVHNSAYGGPPWKKKERYSTREAALSGCVKEIKTYVSNWIKDNPSFQSEINKLKDWANSQHQLALF